MDFDARTKKYSNIINNTLNDAFIMTNTPKLLHDAMKYSIDAGGKRIRPCLTLGVCDILGGNRKYAIRLGSGIEMIHTYSLIHDDRPAWTTMTCGAENLRITWFSGKPGIACG